MIKKLGVQLYTIREYMGDTEQIRSSFNKLKELGYDEIYTTGPGGFTHGELGAIAKSAVWK